MFRKRVCKVLVRGLLGVVWGVGGVWDVDGDGVVLLEFVGVFFVGVEVVFVVVLLVDELMMLVFVMVNWLINFKILICFKIYF